MIFVVLSILIPRSCRVCGSRVRKLVFSADVEVAKTNDAPVSSWCYQRLINHVLGGSGTSDHSISCAVLNKAGFCLNTRSLELLQAMGGPAASVNGSVAAARAAQRSSFMRQFAVCRRLGAVKHTVVTHHVGNAKAVVIKDIAPSFFLRLAMGR